AGAAGADEFLERLAGEQRHDEVRLARAILFELADIEDLDDIGMAHGGEDVALFIEEVERGAARNVAQGLESDAAFDDGVVGFVDNSHAALAEDPADLVTSFDMG